MSESGGSEIEEVGAGGAPHSRLLSSSFTWDPSSNFTSTLDIEAIKVSPSAPSQPVSLSSLADHWDNGPPRLEPHLTTGLERELPKLEAMDQESSSESESEEGSESDSSSSSSCSSIETDSSSDNDDQQQV